ncbi:MAG TPA: hypothetical protein VFP60_11235 [Pseudolabrys sp.]|nr:hypothetical protein [Pseudolabrys sp.]
MTFTLSTIRARGSLEPPGSMTAFAEQVQVMWRGSTVTAAPKARVTDGLTLERARAAGIDAAERHCRYVGAP